MNKSLENILKILSENREELANDFKVEEIGVFGSYSRDEQTESSDVDILVSFREPVGFEFIDLADRLEDLLKRRVDLVTPAAIKPKSRDNILKEVIYA